jgi:hypothetical protein
MGEGVFFGAANFVLAPHVLVLTRSRHDAGSII